MNDSVIGIYSEIDPLEKVIVHTPGPEIESITPENAHKALYSDILNLSMARKEHNQFTSVLSKITKTYELKDLLKTICSFEEVRLNLIRELAHTGRGSSLYGRMVELSLDELVTAMIEGVPMERSTLTHFLDENRFALPPLNNAYFMRDPAFCIFDTIFVSNMATSVRSREALLLEYIFTYHPEFKQQTNFVKPDLIPLNSYFEGGDFIVFNDQVLLVGMGKRTMAAGIDFVIEALKKENRELHVIVQELPENPESFIHLDMVFTLLDKDLALIFEPLIQNSIKYQTFHMHIQSQHKVQINTVTNLPDAIHSLGYDLKCLPCGGSGSITNQEREQWHSGANCFAWAPGKLLGYGRNVHTTEVISKEGYEVLNARDVINDSVSLSDYQKCLITFDGDELARGGGGARCMTLPLKRKY